MRLTFDTTPPGFDLVVDGSRLAAPATLTSWDAYAFVVTAPVQADSAGVPCGSASGRHS